ncbi:hypothetical protein [Stenoxybacter acetivorans]|uniref:hypothetical protein n=1 Tax=Stenoxybacter acetivorans TaxID=422441 RepID=UPI00055F27F7|nr:hypothetical protein [Stenoxybacter acetivorans]
MKQKKSTAKKPASEGNVSSRLLVIGGVIVMSAAVVFFFVLPSSQAPAAKSHEDAAVSAVYASDVGVEALSVGGTAQALLKKYLNTTHRAGTPQSPYIVTPNNIVKAYKESADATLEALTGKTLSVLGVVYGVFSNSNTLMLQSGEPDFTVITNVDARSFQKFADANHLEEGAVILLSSCQLTGIKNKIINLNQCRIIEANQ